MNEDDLTIIFLQKLGVSPDFIIKKAYGKSPEWSAFLLVNTLLKNTSATKAGEVLTASKDTVNLYTNKLVNGTIKSPKGQRTWSISILDHIQYKLCDKCSTYKQYDEFNNSLHKEVGVSTVCKACCKIYNDKYASEHKEEKNARNAIYRAKKYKATPSWADIQEIEQFYIECPKGYQVDHIVPLGGELVCGLHTLDNLQYLTIAENLAKGNKFNIHC